MHRACMSTITAILETDSDGSLHLPVPAELRRGKIKVVALLTAVSTDENGTQAQTTKVRDWVKRAKGSVRLAPGESVDDARMDYYAGSVA